jgi:hypothetical protein
MKTISLESRSFLKERTLKFCIVMVFIPIWLLVLAIYYSRGHTVMPQLQRSILQFLIFTNTITLSLFLAAAILQVTSIKRNITSICSSVVAELSALSFIVCFQLVASIALSAGTPSFQCPLEGSCQGNAFFAVVAWIAPLLFAIHSIEFAVRARRLAAVNPKVWSTATWLVQWDGEALNPKDLERGISISGPKALVLPQTKEVKDVVDVPPPIYEANRSRRVSHQFKVGGHKASNRLSKMPPPPIPPKTPGTETAQYLVINPNKVQYTVPRLAPAPKYFVEIPENISFTVPKISKPPCPKTFAKERKRARKVRQEHQKRQTKTEKAQEGGLKWSFHF